MNWKGVKNWKCVYEAAMKHRVAIGLCAVCLSAFSPIVYYKGKSFWRKPRVAMCEGQGYRCGVERLPPDLCLNRQQRCLNDVDTEWDDRCMLSLGFLGITIMSPLLRCMAHSVVLTALFAALQVTRNVVYNYDPLFLVLESCVIANRLWMGPSVLFTFLWCAVLCFERCRRFLWRQPWSCQAEFYVLLLALHSGIKFGRSKTGKGSSGGRKKGVV